MTGRGFVIPKLTDATNNALYSLLDEDASRSKDLEKNAFLQWKKKNASTTVPDIPRKDSLSSSSDISLMSTEDSRGAAVASTLFAADESQQPFLRHSVDQDKKLREGGSDSEDCGDEEDKNLDQDFLKHKKPTQASSPKPPLLKNSGSNASYSFGTINAQSFPKRKFRYMVQSAAKSEYQRAESQILELAVEFDLTLFPTRVLIANHIKRKIWRPKGVPPPSNPNEPFVDPKTGKPISPYCYDFAIYSSVNQVIVDIMGLPAEDKTLFVVVEENGVIDAFFDLEIPLKWLDENRHGKNALNLFAYCIAMVRSILSSIVGVNLSCWADSYTIYESIDPSKLSAHCHVPWPFKTIGSLRADMEKVKDKLWEMFEAGIEAVRPMFYFGKTEKTDAEWKCIVDLGVYTKKRNFRLAECTKRDKNAYLKLANNRVPLWNRPGKSVCAVDFSIQENTISPAFILARNSRAFWNPITVKFTPLLNKSATNQLIPQVSDFRSLPSTGTLKTSTKRMREIYSKGLIWGDEIIGQGLDQFVDGFIDAFMKEHYEESWIELVRPFAADVQSSFGQVLQNLYPTLRKSPRHLVTTLVILTQIYRPGLGLDQRFVQTSYTLNIARAMAETIEGFLIGGATPNLTKAFAALYVLYEKVESTFSCTGDQLQLSARGLFLKQMHEKFINLYLEPIISRNTYVRNHLADIFVLEALVQNLLMCSGYHIYTFQKDQQHLMTGGKLSLPLMPTDYKQEILIKTFAYCFKVACKREQKYDAPPIAYINAHTVPDKALPVIIKTNGWHHKQSLLQTLHKLRLAKKIRENEDDQEEGDELFTVNVYNSENKAP